MGAQSSLNALVGTVVGGAALATRGLKDNKKADVKVKESKASGKDLKMAAKARRSYQQKINAIYANKEISAKARTRRVGKLLDEYQGGGK